MEAKPRVRKKNNSLYKLSTVDECYVTQNKTTYWLLWKQGFFRPSQWHFQKCKHWKVDTAYVWLSYHFSGQQCEILSRRKQSRLKLWLLHMPSHTKLKRKEFIVNCMNTDILVFFGVFCRWQNYSNFISSQITYKDGDKCYQ